MKVKRGELKLKIEEHIKNFRSSFLIVGLEKQAEEGADTRS